MKRGKWERREEMRGGKLSWEDLLLLDSVFIITAAVHRGNLAGYIKRLIHSPPTTSDTHTTRHTHTLTLLSVNTQEKLIPYNRLIPRLKDVISQSLLPKLLALGSEVCFYNCSGFHLNELKFHLSGAPCPCQHILQMES